MDFGVVCIFFSVIEGKEKAMGHFLWWAWFNGGVQWDTR